MLALLTISERRPNLWRSLDRGSALVRASGCAARCVRNSCRPISNSERTPAVVIACVRSRYRKMDRSVSICWQWSAQHACTCAPAPRALGAGRARPAQRAGACSKLPQPDAAQPGVARLFPQGGPTSGEGGHAWDARRQANRHAASSSGSAHGSVWPRGCTRAAPRSDSADRQRRGTAGMLPQFASAEPMTSAVGG